MLDARQHLSEIGERLDGGINAGGVGGKGGFVVEHLPHQAVAQGVEPPLLATEGAAKRGARFVLSVAEVSEGQFAGLDADGDERRVTGDFGGGKAAQARCGFSTLFGVLVEVTLLIRHVAYRRLVFGFLGRKLGLECGKVGAQLAQAVGTGLKLALLVAQRGDLTGVVLPVNGTEVVEGQQCFTPVKLVLAHFTLLLQLHEGLIDLLKGLLLAA